MNTAQTAMTIESVAGTRVDLDVEVEYSIDPGDPGDFMTPPEGPRLDSAHFRVERLFMGGTRAIERSERPSWFAWLDTLAAEHFDEFDFLEKHAAPCASR